MSDISLKLRKEVIGRAQNRCEYCKLSQVAQEAAFHIDHIIPRSAGGETEIENLALACVSCSLRKGSLQSAPDPESGDYVELYHPRRANWVEHFSCVGVKVLGITPIGRATVRVLGMNRARMLAIREEEAMRGRYPAE